MGSNTREGKVEHPWLTPRVLPSPEKQSPELPTGLSYKLNLIAKHERKSPLLKSHFLSLRANCMWGVGESPKGRTSKKW